MELKIICFFFRSSGKPINSSDFKYLGKYEPLNLDLFRPGQPNSKTGDDQCIISYFGLEPNVSWYALKLNLVCELLLGKQIFGQILL